MVFGDDTSIFYSHSDPKYLESIMNEELKNFDIWMKYNKLSVNAKKTNYIILKSNRKKIANNISLSLGNEMLEQKKAVKFLGVYLDEHLMWKDHISYVCKINSKSVSILHKFRFNLTLNTKLPLYYTLIYPYITYSNLAWSSTYVSNLNGIFSLQKRAVRAINNADFLFLHLGILDIFKVR